MDTLNNDLNVPEDRHDLFEQNKSEDNQVHSKNLSEYASIRVSIGMEQKLKRIFRGIQNAKSLIEDQVDPKK